MSTRVIFNQPLDEISTTKKDQLGAVLWYNDECYKYVQIKNTTATVAGVAGDPVAYGKAADSGYENDLVVIDLSDADASPVPAGFLMGSVAGVLGTTYYGWIKTQGLVTVPTAITNGVVGQCVYLTSGDKTLAKGAAVTDCHCGVELTATGANNKIIARCPF